MTAPEVAVFFAPGFTWQSEPASITWENITAYVLQDSRIRVQRGAAAARGAVDVGRLNLVLKNDDRRFDPTHGTGPYYGDLVPGVPIKIFGETDESGYVTTYASTFSADVAPVFTGTVARWPQRYDLGGQLITVPVEGFDGFDKFSRAKLSRSVLESALLEDDPIGLWKLDETTGSGMLDSSGNDRHGEYLHGTLARSEDREFPGGGVYRGVDFDGEHEGQVADIAAALAGRPFTIFGLIQVPYEGATNSGVVLRCGSGNPGNSPTSRNMEVAVTASGIDDLDIIGYARDGDADDGVAAQGLTVGIREPCVFTFRRASSGASQMWVNGANETTVNSTTAAAFASAPGVAIGSESNVVGGQDALTGWLAYVALFQSDLGTSRIAELADIADAPLDGQTTDERIGWVLDELDWPTNLRDLEVGQTTLGPATFKPGDGALEYLRLVNASEDGLLFIDPSGQVRFLDRYWKFLDTLATTSQFTFTDATGSTSYAEFDLDVDDDLLTNIARVTRRGGAEQVSENTTSVNAYGAAEIQVSDVLVRTDAEARSLGDWIVASRGTPLPRVPKIRVPLHRYTAANQLAVLNLDLGHRVSAVRTPSTGVAVDLDFVIDGISHDIGGGEWWWEAFVSPVPEETLTPFIWGTSEWGGTDVWAY